MVESYIRNGHKLYRSSCSDKNVRRTTTKKSKCHFKFFFFFVHRVGHVLSCLCTYVFQTDLSNFSLPELC